MDEVYVAKELWLTRILFWMTIGIGVLAATPIVYNLVKVYLPKTALKIWNFIYKDHSIVISGLVRTH